MELNINELDDETFLEEYLNEHAEDIPENNFQNVNQNKNYIKREEPIKPMHQSIPKAYAKKVRPPVAVEKPKVSYDDILNKLGMFVADGELHLKNNHAPEVRETVNPEKNSYIYNKYFNKEVKNEPNVRVPKNIYEYRDMLIQDIIQKQRIKQIKSTQLILPNTNVYSYSNTKSNMNLNSLFNFSNR